MRDHPCRTRHLGFLVALGVALAGLGTLTPGAFAADTTKVSGTVKDLKGAPIPGVKIHFEHAKIKGKTTPTIKTNKKGKFSFPFLDIGSGTEWRVFPVHPDFLTLRVVYESVDSAGATRDQGNRVLDEKQEYPVIRFSPIGKGVAIRGRNQVDFVMVLESEFSRIRNEVLAEQVKKSLSSEELAAQEETEAKQRKQKVTIKAFDAGVQQAKQGDHARAIENFQMFLSLDPDHETGHYELGKSQLALGKNLEAEGSFRRALELNPNLAGAHFRLGLLFAKQKRYAEAETEFRQEVEGSPEEPALLFNLALAIYEQGKYLEAIPWLEKVAEVEPENAEVFWNLAKIYERQGEKAKANEQYERFAQVNPGEADIAYYNIGREAWNQGRREDAITAFRKALEANGNHADAHRQLGYCLVGTGSFDAAIEHFRRFLELKPNSPLAPEIRQTIAQLSD